MSDLPQHAEAAIAAFEALTGLSVSLHDHSRRWLPILPPERFFHLHPICLRVKTTRNQQCVDFDLTHCAKQATLYPQGFRKRCHAGLVELVLPHQVDDRLLWVLFAGPLRNDALTCAVVTPQIAGGWRPAVAQLPLTSAARIDTDLEALRQLDARLTALLAAHPDETVDRVHLRTRAQKIRYFIAHQHRQPVRVSDLARYLELSVPRTSHAVREACGATFSDLLTEARLRSAANLLRHASMNIDDVARACGVGDAAHFHRLFLRRYGLTPGHFRAQQST